MHTYASTRVEKNHKTEDGRLLTQSLKNTDLMTASHGRRKLEDMTLSNLKISGSYLHGRFDNGFWFRDLEVDGGKSAGVLDYTGYDGHDTPIDGCSFGDRKIISLPGKVALNYENLFDIEQCVPGYTVPPERGDTITRHPFPFPLNVVLPVCDREYRNVYEVQTMVRVTDLREILAEKL